LDELTPDWLAINVIPGPDFDQVRADATLDRMNELVWSILPRRAQTVAGLAVQTRAITMAAADLWDGEGWDGEGELTHECAFIEAVCGFVGISREPQVGQSVAALPRPKPADPIFEAIEAHRAAK
jgi:hypothetical protein